LQIIESRPWFLTHRLPPPKFHIVVVEEESAPLAMSGDWLLVQELFERGDSEFVDKLRGIADAEGLASFAERWYANSAPAARQLLLAYLERPLNAFRHESIVKRLFKRAEAAGDDLVMARFLVAFDRSVRRVQRKRYHFLRQRFTEQRKAQKLADALRSQGYDNVNVWSSKKAGFLVSGELDELFLTSPAGTTMPRGKLVEYVVGRDPRTGKSKKFQAPDWVIVLNLPVEAFRNASLPPEKLRGKLERFRLFSLATRRYLQRRAWRYFRRLGKTHPERYIAAITEALALYRDEDVTTGLALLDNWGLVHALFHHSPVLEAGRRGWVPAPGRSLSELKPAPAFAPLWREKEDALFALLYRASCRPVRRWAMAVLSRDPSALCAGWLELILLLLDHQDDEIVAWAAELLTFAEDLSNVPTARWLEAARSAGPQAVTTLAELMSRHIKPDRVELIEAVALCASRALPLARLGLDWLKLKNIDTDEQRRALLALLEAECLPLRNEILAFLRAALGSAASFHSDWLLALLDCRHDDARAAGLDWFRAESAAHEDVTVWQKLLESPYDDVRFAMVSELDDRVRHTKPLELAEKLDSDRLRLLWATVLLNVQRGSRTKPGVIGQVARRLEKHPEEAEALLPILNVGMRSLRRPERAASLAAIVRLVHYRPEILPLIRATFPQLQLS
jgi:hypothetical protein